MTFGPRIYFSLKTSTDFGTCMQREDERKKDGGKVIEVRRQPTTGQGDRRNRDRGPRASLDRNGPDRGAGRGAYTR